MDRSRMQSGRIQLGDFGVALPLSASSVSTGSFGWKRLHAACGANGPSDRGDTSIDWLAFERGLPWGGAMGRFLWRLVGGVDSVPRCASDRGRYGCAGCE